ncbi:MAG TPA: hypothetical protein VHC49_11155 [Mycobacteriales bacterium]|nr:hypothetical protein [Mycobacteriales bacterium]
MTTSTISKVAAIGAAVAALSVGGVLTAGPASASGGVCTVGDHCSGNVTFTSKNEIFYIHDYNRDGHAVYGLLEAKFSDGWHVIKTDINTRGYDAAPLRYNLSIKEGRAVRYQVCLSEHTRLFHCSSWYHDRA